ncbi:hypothetical protein SR1949_13050 [Sphaerospermopsis reniformis]|uniref:Uncharacterized protein n=1 Tax=Sphaerospermopsis reniformis TaxID=531300 RepID=A0A479ZXN2_9CYAN|nr:hypothetical protein [Sphaerospermopsis reniformis]GCL36203.1 hypothetical protein SR1949_13050 [Sphaerospermopsis reniformis]
MSRPSFVIFAQNYLFALLSNYGNVFLNELIPRNPKLRVDLSEIYNGKMVER